jgi:hypothetical protein
VISFTVTQPNTGLAMSVVAGDSANVRGAGEMVRARIIGMWSKAQAVGFSQVTFQSGNDQIRNIRTRNTVNTPVNMFPMGVATSVRPQELLTAFQAGSNTAGDVELLHLMMCYDDLSGGQANLIESSELRRRGVRCVTVEDTITATAASAYSGARALNVASDLLRANTDYAVLGASIGINCGALTIRGTDTANLRCAVPGQALVDNSGVNWFKNLSEAFGEPMIPVINTANKAGIFTEIVQDENLVAVPFSWFLVELSP